MDHQDLAQYKPLYLQTAWDYVRQLESCILRLKDDPTNAEAINTSHISAHSLKSQSYVMNYQQLGTVCHSLELLFKSLKDGAKPLQADEVTKLTGIIESIKDAVTQISAHDKDPDMSGETHIIEEMTQRRSKTP